MKVRIKLKYATLKWWKKEEAPLSTWIYSSRAYDHPYRYVIQICLLGINLGVIQYKYDD